MNSFSAIRCLCRTASLTPKRAFVLALTALVCAGLGVISAWKPRPWVVWNASGSVPIGLYLVATSRSLRHGDLVLVRLPYGARNLAAERSYLPADTPAIKHVAAIEGDRVCTVGGSVYINGMRRAGVLLHDRSGRQLMPWMGCLRLVHGQIFLLNDTPASFDGRYFGPSSSADVIGILIPLWTF